MTLDEYLTTHRETEEEFADRSGISRATVFRIKKQGARTAATIEKIVSATGGEISAAELLPSVPETKSRRMRKKKDAA